MPCPRDTVTVLTCPTGNLVQNQIFWRIKYSGNPHYGMKALEYVTQTSLLTGPSLACGLLTHLHENPPPSCTLRSWGPERPTLTQAILQVKEELGPEPDCLSVYPTLTVSLSTLLLPWVRLSSFTAGGPRPNSPPPQQLLSI